MTTAAITEQQLTATHQAMLAADLAYANHPSAIRLRRVVLAQRAYYVLYSRYVRQQHPPLLANLLRAKMLRKRVQQNKRLWPNLPKQTHTDSWQRAEQMHYTHQYLWEEQQKQTRRKRRTKEEMKEESQTIRQVRVKSPLTGVYRTMWFDPANGQYTMQYPTYTDE